MLMPMKITKLIVITTAILFALTLANLVLLFPDTRQLLRLAAEREAEKPPAFALTTIAPDDCPDCFTTALFIDTLKKQQVSVRSERFLAVTDPEAQQLIAQYAIQKLPTLLIEGAFEKSEQLKKQLETIGTFTENTFVWRNVQPLYKDLATGEIRGRFSVTYLADAQCATCYDVMRHAQALANVGLVTSNDRVVDIGSDEGKELKKRYTITAVPTILLSGDLSVYDSLKAVWGTVGTVEDDGTYVFRENGIVDSGLGPYRSLKTEKIIIPAATSSSNGRE